MTAQLGLPSYADVEPMEQEWLWEGRIPLGEVTVLAGDSGIGKGFLMADLAARVSNGDTMPDGSPGPEAGSVVMVTPEDNPETATVHRLTAAGADLGRVHDITETPEGEAFELARDGGSMPYLHQVARELGDVRLVIIDPLTAVSSVSLGAVVTVRRNIMRPAQLFARDTGAAVLIVHHVTKSGEVAGSKGLRDAARSLLRVEVDGQDARNRVLSVLKTNVTKREQVPDVRYRIGGEGTAAAVEWQPGTVTTKPEPAAAEVLVAEASGYGVVAKAKPSVTEYQALIMAALRTGPLDTQQIAARTGIAHSSARVLCTRLERRGLLSKTRRGIYGLPGQGLRVA